jgi:predicted dehydrogenase
MNRIRTAVIGVGYLGAFHAQKYAMLEDSVLVGVVDTNGEYPSPFPQSITTVWQKTALKRASTFSWKNL